MVYNGAPVQSSDIFVAKWLMTDTYHFSHYAFRMTSKIQVVASF